MRLYRALVREETHILYDSNAVTKEAMDALMPGLHLAVLVDVQNVADFCWSEAAPHLRQMQGLLPPWEMSWYEWTNQVHHRIGVLVQGTRLEPEGAAVVRAKTHADEMAAQMIRDGFGSWDFPDEGFVMMADVFEEYRTSTVAVHVGHTMWATDVEGNPVLSDLGRFPLIAHAGTDLTDMIGFATRVAATACSFANCRNVRLVEEEGMYASRQERRHAERNGLPAPPKYYTLRIDPNATSTKRPSTKTENTRDLPLHIVRGHFAHYTEAAPLFGKLVGRFWVPAHVRGTLSAGEIVKDYAIDARRSA